MNIRLDKYLVSAQAGSRSEIKELCRKGQVTVNGQICRTSDTRINPDRDIITLRGIEMVSTAHRQLCYLLNKPQGVLSANEDRHDRTIFDLMPDISSEQFFSIGRLDKDSEGMLLVTNDGQLSHRLTSPRYHVDKTYEVMITGILSKEDIVAFEAGVDIGDDTCTRPAAPITLECFDAYRLSEEEKKKLPQDISDVIQASLVRLTITEGRFHQVKRMFHACRHEVFSLKRTAIGQLKLDQSLEAGRYRLLTEEEEKMLSIPFNTER